jgi:hypothetical protein
MTTAKSKKTTHDELTAIKGIGEATARCLREALQVDRAGDLLAHSVEEIEAALKGGARAVSRDRIEDWLARASELNEREESTLPQDEWTAFAAFVVEFQGKPAQDGTMERRTTVHHMKDGKEETWPSFERVKPWRWMLDRVGEQSKAESVEPAPVETPAPALPPEPATQVVTAPTPHAPRAAAVEITGIRAFQPPSSDKPLTVASDNRMHSVTVKGGQPVLFELSVQLGGPDADTMASAHSQLNAEIYTYNRSTTGKTHLCEVGGESAARDNMSYTMRLPETTLERGTYRLECLATLEGTPRLNGYLKVPSLQVV